ncbi:MAG: cbb3-type cytochrome c oxidase N-terminal domain-containing protein [Panacibacter sp.]
MNRHLIRISTTLLPLIPLMANAAGPKQPSEASNPYAIAMISVAAILLLAIMLVAQLLLQQAKAKLFHDKKNDASKTIKTIVVAGLCFISGSLFAQDAAATDAQVPAAVVAQQLSDTSFYALLAVIGVELLILIMMLLQLRSLMALEEDPAIVLNAAKGKAIAKKEPYWKKLWEKANSFKPIKEEATIDLGHDYDGIRELDNRLPPWWLYGFYACIIFSVVYLWRTDVSHMAPSSIEEFQASMKVAAEEKEAYLAKSKSNVDESTVKLLTESSDIDAGKKVFTTMCAACHGADGGGTVGPNLTDNYWMHGGTIQDVFKTIKYGWPEKGMKSWKDDYSPVQIAQIASYVKSLHGTKPATPKEPQGELFEETGAPGPVADSVKNAPEIK